MIKPDPALAEYSTIIERLKPLTGQPDFENVLESLAPNLPKPKRFLIKMELNRLAGECSRRIDLRGHVEGNVQEFEHDSTEHYLDEIAIRIFKRGLKIYGQYTIGTYEEIMNAENNFRVMHERDKSQRLKARDNQTKEKNETGEKTEYVANPIEFGNRGFRTEERMIYSMAIEVEMPLGHTVMATTTDLSVSGCKIKLPSTQRVMEGQTLKVSYTGLEEEYSLGLKEPVEYEVMGVDSKSDHLYPRCRRTFNNELPAFDEFLNRFINGNKRRYKINLDNTVEAVVTKGYEQFYLPRVNTLPVFIAENKHGQLFARCSLSNDNNKQIARQWLDENNESQLGYAFSNKRLKTLLKKTGRVKETLIYGFTHVSKGRVYFYSATIDELNEDPEIKRIFLAFGASKSVWFTYKLQLIDCHPELAHLPLTLPDTASAEAVKLNRPPSSRIMGFLESIKHVAYITDISTTESKAQYSKLGFELAEVNLLKPYGHIKTSPLPKIEDVMFKFVNLRSETRFIYRTQVSIATDDLKEEGVTRDFSTKGLQVEFETPINIQQDQVINIALPEMQRITSRFKLKQLPYEVVSLNDDKTIINLKTFEMKGTQHSGKAFMQELIEKNRAKLKAASQAGSGLAGLAESLRNIVAQRTLNTALFIHKDGTKHKIDGIGFSKVPNPVVEQLQSDNESGQFNLYPLLHNNYFNTLFVSTIRRIQRQSRPEELDIFIKVKMDAVKISDRFESSAVSDFRNEAAQKIFVQKATQKSCLFMAIRIYISRTGRPDTDFIAKELAYVSQYAIHKAKVLEDELWSVAGVVDLIDISEEVMNRFAFKKELITEQMQKRAIIK